MRGRKLGLALGGGAVRGAAHVGVLKVLEEYGVKPHMVAGSSAGSIVAALYAVGWSVPALEKMVQDLKPNYFFDELAAVENFLLMSLKLAFDLLHIPFPLSNPLGLMRGDKLEKFIDKLLEQHSFYCLPIKLAITAVDVNCGTKVVFVSEESRKILALRDLEEVFISNVPLAQAVRASTSLPGIYQPKRVGKYLLMDGGVRENVPAEVLKKLGADVVLAVDLGYQKKPGKKISNIVSLLSQTLEIIQSDTIQRVLQGSADILIRPDLSDVSIWDFKRIPYIIKQGEAATREVMPKILKALDL